MTIKSTPNKTPRVFAVRNLPSAEEKQIHQYLSVLVDACCQNSAGSWFGLRDLMGGANKDWSGTPLQVLYERHVTPGADPRYAYSRAAVDGGRLLKQVLDGDQREFESKKGYRTALYRLVT